MKRRSESLIRAISRLSARKKGASERAREDFIRAHAKFPAPSVFSINMQTRARAPLARTTSAYFYSGKLFECNSLSGELSLSLSLSLVRDSM